MRSRRSFSAATASRRRTISSTYDPCVDVATVDEWLIRAWRDDALAVLALDDPPPFALELAARVLALATLLLPGG